MADLRMIFTAVRRDRIPNPGERTDIARFVFRAIHNGRTPDIVILAGRVWVAMQEANNRRAIREARAAVVAAKRQPGQ